MKGERAAIAVVGLGANLGDRAATIERMLDGFRSGELRDTDVLARSTVFENPAVGPVAQPDFLNAVAALDTDLDPRTLLRELLALETRLGRVRHERWGPRTIDLDLVAWVPAGSARSHVLDEDGLTLPHPRAHLRDFVLRPLAELWPELVLAGRTVAEHLAALPHR